MRALAWTALLAAAGAGVALGGSADEDWQALLALDAGPQTRPRSPAEAQAAIVAHLATQERALRTFLAAHPADARGFEARLRFARLLGLRGEILNDGKARAEAARLLDGLEKSATPGQRTELDFARLAQAMRRLDALSAVERDALLARVRAFQSAHPEDRRLPDLLAEIATVFDGQPKTKLKLLLEAQTLARDEQLQARLADDLRRVELLNQPIALTAPSTTGRTINLEDYRGRLVLVCFFAAWSEPSLQALDTLKKAAASFPKDRVQILGVSLDTKPEPLAELLKDKALAWPVVCDGQGWESPLIRGFGINSLPTVWLLDRAGKLRSLNALENTADQIRQFPGER